MTPICQAEVRHGQQRQRFGRGGEVDGQDGIGDAELSQAVCVDGRDSVVQDVRFGVWRAINEDC